MSPRMIVMVNATAAIALLAACRGGGAADTGWSLERVEHEEPTAGVAVLDAVRTARHDGFERVVFQFRGDRVPGYVVEYATDAPAQCASGAPVSVPGAAHLTVRLAPADAHAQAGEDVRSTIPERALRPGYPAIRAVVLTCDFEAVVGWVIGLSDRRPFRVITVGQPPRIVVDVGRSR